jgi:drug/metabolite transporter (DMT)-like permease
LTDNTAGIVWALLSAIVLAFQGVASAKPLRRMGILAASVLTNGVNVLVLGVLGLLFYEEGQASLEGIAWFSLLGITAYSYGRFVYYKALFTIGPPRLTTIMSTAPLLTLFLAVFFLAERPGPAVLAGTSLVIVGVMLVSYEPTEKGWFHRGIIWGFASALSLGVSTFIRKKGMAAFPNPMLTVAWANLIGIPILLTVRKYSPPVLFEWGGRSTVIVIALLGILNSANQVFINMAVFYGDVSVVTPIITSSPIFSLLFTILLLRDLERIRASLVIGVLITVVGMIFIAIGR